ncbi:hypothetical protein BDM02DRAFT_3192164 [Thelephora ganbajun]|uniref:Uncharacterized protein n=1 Tax=Thelephora ganbajun TaxID=370292 RepID=A0ACB6Z109_THEGA|nr:hypothetical protein BDM02DRAFT_3192164 [Thelephora ganbajun]
MLHLATRTRPQHAIKFKLTFQLNSGATIVDVMELSTQNSFHAIISNNYGFHLAWIQHESVGNSKRSRWLQNVLDHFAEELRQAPKGGVDPSWRSPVLNPLLVRAFYGVADDKVGLIKEKVVAMVARSACKDPSLEDWTSFYTSSDVIDPAFEAHWMKLKPCGVDQGNSGLSAEATPGVLATELLEQSPAIEVQLTETPAETGRDEWQSMEIAAPMTTGPAPLLSIQEPDKGLEGCESVQKGGSQLVERPSNLSDMVMEDCPGGANPVIAKQPRGRPRKQPPVAPGFGGPQTLRSRKQQPQWSEYPESQSAGEVGDLSHQDPSSIWSSPPLTPPQSISPSLSPPTSQGADALPTIPSVEHKAERWEAVPTPIDLESQGIRSSMLDSQPTGEDTRTQTTSGDAAEKLLSVRPL